MGGHYFGDVHKKILATPRLPRALQQPPAVLKIAGLSLLKEVPVADALKTPSASQPSSFSTLYVKFYGSVEVCSPATSKSACKLNGFSTRDYSEGKLYGFYLFVCLSVQAYFTILLSLNGFSLVGTFANLLS